MKVKELKELCSQLPDDGYVHFTMLSGCCGDEEELEVCFAEAMVFSDFSGLRIQFSPLPGYHSCRQASSTKQDDEEYWTIDPKRTK